MTERDPLLDRALDLLVHWHDSARCLGCTLAGHACRVQALLDEVLEADVRPARATSTDPATLLKLKPVSADEYGNGPPGEGTA